MRQFFDPNRTNFLILIPLAAVFLGDSDAMSRDDSGQLGKSLPEIVEELTAGAGTQFDPALVAAFKGLAEQGEIQL